MKPPGAGKTTLVPRIVRTPVASPVSTERDDEPLPPLPVRTLPPALRAKAQWVDEQFGNRDGTLSKRELAAYKRAYGSDAGHRATIAALERHLELGTPAPRPARTTTVTLTADAAARQLVSPAGRGTRADVDAVVSELKKLPTELLVRAHRAGVRVVACRESVTDFLTHLRGVTPRGWSPGSTWDRVPGLYDPASMTVVMATHDGARGASERVLPDFGYGHGSFNALFHEFGHAIDGTNALGLDSRSPAFRDAYTLDVPALRAANHTYLLQPGDAGPEEAYAEMAARYFGNDPQLGSAFPNLHRFFDARARELERPT